MYKKKKILAIIPARSGSKRIKNKNIITFKNKPMILHALKIAKSIKFFDKVIVSTNSKKIKNICKMHGDTTPFLRDKYYDDKSSVHLATLRAVEQSENYFGKFDIVVQLMPNCPHRTKKCVESAVRYFFRKKFKSQISFFKFNFSNPWWAHVLKRGKIKSLFKNFNLKRSQDLPELFCPTGSVWISYTSVLKKYKSFYSPNYGFFLLDFKEAIDIDTVEELKIAKKLI